MYACVTCRVGSKHIMPVCSRDNHNVKDFTAKITVPKKNNHRAWKRIERGERLWDRRKVRKRAYKRPETIIHYQYRYEYVELPSGKKARVRRRVEGSGREVTNMMQLPHVDLGG